MSAPERIQICFDKILEKWFIVSGVPQCERTAILERGDDVERYLHANIVSEKDERIAELEEELKQAESDRDWYKQSFEDDMTLKLVQAIEFISQNVACTCTAQMLQENIRDCPVCKLLSKLECKEKK